MNERYVIRSITGFPISWDSAANTGHERTFWYVLDSAVCYRIMRELIGQNAELRAREAAERLNAEHDDYLRGVGWSG
jgi:hypothetical protein